MFALFGLAFAVGGCAPSVRLRVRVGPGPIAVAAAVAVLPVSHWVGAAPHEAFTRALPVTSALVRAGGHLVIGPDEVPLPRRTLGLRGLEQMDAVVNAAQRAGVTLDRLLLWRTFIEERVTKTAKALFDTRGRPRGAGRDVDATLVVRMVLRLVGRAEPLLEARASAAEDPFAKTAEHDRRPLARRLVKLLAARVLEALPRVVARPPVTIGPLDVELLPGLVALERFRLGAEPSLAERLREQPLIEAQMRALHARGLADDATPGEGQVWRGAPAGVLVRSGGLGLQAGDVVTEVEGEGVLTPWAMQRALYRRGEAGERRAKVWRAGQVLGVTLANPRVERREGAAAGAARDVFARRVDVERTATVRAEAAHDVLGDLGVEGGPQVVYVQRVSARPRGGRGAPLVAVR